MSAHDFQAKFASVMESILQSAIAETTKLFEAMVDELKADMSRIKKDNDDLKAKCIQFECAQKGATAGKNPPEKCHRAVQCDIISFCNKVAEQSHPSVPNQSAHQKTFYPLQEHDYDVRGNGRTVVGHKSEQQEVNSAYSGGDFLNAEAESPRTSESAGASTKTRELLHTLPALGMYINLQGGRNQEIRPPTSGPPTIVGRRGPPPNSALIVNTSQATSLQPRERNTSVTLQDARLLVEAMSSPLERSVLSSKPSMAVGGPTVGATQSQADGASADLQILPHSSESPQAAHSLILKDFVAAAASAQGSVNVTQPSGTESQVRASSAATPAAVQPRGSSALKTSAPSKEVKRLSQKIMVMPRLAVSLVSYSRATQCATQASTAAVKVDPAKITGKVPTTTAPEVTDGALSASSVPVKRPLNSSSSTVPATKPTIYRKRPSEVQRRPIIKIVFPAQQTVEVAPEPERSGGKEDHFPSQEANLSLEPSTPPATAPPVPQKEPSQSCVSENSSEGLNIPAACHIKPFAVVRLTRLPFPMSEEDSILVSRLPLGAGWDSLSAPKQHTGSSRLSSKLLPVITTNSSGASSPPGSPSANGPQSEATSETGQILEEERSSKDQETDSTSSTKTGSSAIKNFQPHSEVGRTSYQHAETQTTSHKKIKRNQQDCKIKLDLLEIAEAVESLRTNRDSSVQTSKSGLSHGVTEPPASKDKDPDDDIGSSKQGTTIQTTTQRTSLGSLVRNVTTTTAHPGLRHPDTEATPRSPRKTGSGPDTGGPKRAASDSSMISSKPKTRAAEVASVVHGVCTSVQPGSPLKDGKKGSNSLERRESGGSDAEFKSTVGNKPRLTQAETTPKMNLRVVNAKKLAKKAKANLRKRKASRQLHNYAKTPQLKADPPSSAAVRKIRSAGVWVPPVGDATENEPARVSLKTEAASPKAPDGGVVLPPRVSLHPPAKAAPVVSPLQPLSLIGSRLLKNQCGVCGQVLGSSSALESHVSLHKRRPFSCRLCGKIFPDTKALKRHGRVHRNGKIHACQKCGKAFVYKFSLTKHLQMVHRRIKPFVCQICSKSFFTKLDVESHIRIHTGEKPFHCDLCERKFIRRVDLNVHLRWHNGEKRHWCPYCKKGFLDFNNLKRHKYIHTGEKPHPCTHCPKQFTQSAHLKKHIKNVHKIAGGS